MNTTSAQTLEAATDNARSFEAVDCSNPSSAEIALTQMENNSVLYNLHIEHEVRGHHTSSLHELPSVPA